MPTSPLTCENRRNTMPWNSRWSHASALIILLSIFLVAACSGDASPSGDTRSVASDETTDADSALQARPASGEQSYGDSAPPADSAPPRPSDAIAVPAAIPPASAAVADAPEDADSAPPPGTPAATATSPSADAAARGIDDSEQLILPADPESNDEFAWSLGLGGDLLISGAPLADDNGGSSGVAYLFRWDGGTWGQIAKLVAEDGAEGDWFGKSAAVSGNTAVVGANLDDGPLRGEFFDDDTGSVYVFDRRIIGDGEIWRQTAKLRAPEQLEWAEFGFAVEIDGDTLAVAAYHDPTRHVDGGAVYVFARSDEEWLLEARLFPADGAAADEFGTAIALQGDTLIVGSPGDDGRGTNAGAAIVYRRVAGTWERESVLRAPDGVEFDAFGFSVGLAGDSAIVGAPFHDGGNLEGGGAYLFQRDGAVWSAGTRLLPAGLPQGAWFGRAVALTPNFAVIGAPRFNRITHDGIANELFALGKTYVFQRTASGWVEHAALLADDGAEGDDFGWTLAAQPGVIVVGAWLADTPAGPDAGLAYAFQLPN